MPEVNDEHESCRVAVMPHLVLERVVEDNELAFFPCAKEQTISNGQ